MPDGYVVRLLFEFEEAEGPAHAVRLFQDELKRHGLEGWTYRAENMRTDEMFHVKNGTVTAIVRPEPEPGETEQDLAARAILGDAHGGADTAGQTATADTSVGGGESEAGPVGPAD